MLAGIGQSYYVSLWGEKLLQVYAVQSFKEVTMLLCYGQRTDFVAKKERL